MNPRPRRFPGWLVALASLVAAATSHAQEYTVRAFIEPVFQIRKEHPHFPAVLGRVVMEGLMPVVGDVFRSTFYQCLLRFTESLSRALPELPEAEIRRRLLFTIAVFHFLCKGQEAFEEVSGERGALDDDGMAEHVVRFCEAGMRAPIPSREGTP